MKDVLDEINTYIACHNERVPIHHYLCCFRRHMKCDYVIISVSIDCIWINDWVNNREAGDLRRYRAHYDVIVMNCTILYTAVTHGICMWLKLFRFNCYILCDVSWWIIKNKRILLVIKSIKIKLLFKNILLSFDTRYICKLVFIHDGLFSLLQLCKLSE